MIKANLNTDKCERCGKIYDINDGEAAPFCSKSCENIYLWENGCISGMTGLFKDLELNFNRSEWCRSRTVEQWIGLLKDEIEELEEGLKEKDQDNAREELGDVIHNTICLMLSMEHHRLAYVPSVLNGSVRKLRDRKPWIFDGSNKYLSSEEENALYKKMKEKLRNG